MKKSNNNDLRKTRDLLRPRYVALPIAIGLIAVGTMFWRDSEQFDFSLIQISTTSIEYFLLALLFMAGRDFGLTWRFRTLTDHDITWGQALRVNMLCEFTSAVTPSTVGGSSFGMIYLTGEGLNFGRSTAIMITTLFLDELFYVVACPIALALIGWSGLFDISNAHISSTIRLTFWFVYGGLSLWALILGLGIFVRPSAIRSLLINACRLPLLRRWKKEAAEMGDAIVATSGELRQKSFWWWLRAFFGTALSWISRYMVVNAILLAFAINADQVMVLARQLVMWVVLTICQRMDFQELLRRHDRLRLAGFAAGLMLAHNQLLYLSNHRHLCDSVMAAPMETQTPKSEIKWNQRPRNNATSSLMFLSHTASGTLSCRQARATPR